MGLTQLLIFFTSLSLIAAGVMFFWWRRDLVSLRRNTDERAELQRKLEAARSELGELKEENRKRRAELVEAREQARKSKRKRGGGEAEPEVEAAAASAELGRLQDEVKKLNAALAGAEARVQRLQDEKATAVAEAERAADERARGAAAEQVKAAQDKVAALERELQDLRAQLVRASSETPPADVRVSLDGVAPELVAELRRFYKRASNNEKLYLQARGKLEALSDKLAETTRRYNAVCRELALAAGQHIPAGDEGDRQAARVAQDVVAAAEDVARRRRRKPQPRRAGRDGGTADAQDAAPDHGETGAPDDAVAGASEHGEATAAEPAAAEAAVADGDERAETST
jgi:chromosome segregation ATPase